MVSRIVFVLTLVLSSNVFADNWGASLIGKTANTKHGVIERIELSKEYKGFLVGLGYNNLIRANHTEHHKVSAALGYCFRTSNTQSIIPQFAVSKSIKYDQYYLTHSVALRTTIESYVVVDLGVEKYMRIGQESISSLSPFVGAGIQF